MSALIEHLAANEERRTAVIREMEGCPDIHSGDISVKPYGPTVTPTGFVPTFAEKAKAEKALKSVRGVLSVANGIVVRPSTRTDPEIARDVHQVLKSNVMVPLAKITATVHEGFVTLEGRVEWNYEKSAVVEAVEPVRGVRAVINRITVETRVSPSSVKQAIEAALDGNPEIDAQGIQVSTYDNTVQLWGTVHSFAQRAEAERAAWAAPGIESVVNRIMVTYPD